MDLLLKETQGLRKALMDKDLQIKNLQSSVCELRKGTTLSSGILNSTRPLQPLGEVHGSHGLTQALIQNEYDQSMNQGAYQGESSISLYYNGTLGDLSRPCREDQTSLPNLRIVPQACNDTTQSMNSMPNAAAP